MDKNEIYSKYTKLRRIYEKTEVERQRILLDLSHATRDLNSRGISNGFVRLIDIEALKNSVAELEQVQDSLQQLQAEINELARQCGEPTLNFN
jgi:hypothetical protein